MNAASSDDVRHRAAVLGSPIGHSLSPVLHRAAYRELGLDDWTYDKFEVDEAGLPAFLAGLGPQWAGLSLTMPLKRAVIPLLDEIGPEALLVNAVNTVILRPDGSSRGENTDVPGMVAALRERTGAALDRRDPTTSAPGATAAAGSTAVLGAGATASSALAALASLGRREVDVYVRTRGRAAELEAIAATLDLSLRVRQWEEARASLDAELLISTTPTGATDELAEQVPPSPATLFEIVYDPWPTPLAAAWLARGGTVVTGLDLLLHQAADQVELITGRAPAPLGVMRAAGEAALAARSGKSA
jgi:shikimate dehydrogenase